MKILTDKKENCTRVFIKLDNKTDADIIEALNNCGAKMVEPQESEDKE